MGKYGKNMRLVGLSEVIIDYSFEAEKAYERKS
jgi:hypothetical protein